MNVPCHRAGSEALTEGGDTRLAVGREAGQGRPGRHGGEPEPDGARGLSDVAHGRRGDGARGRGGDGRGHGHRSMASEVSVPLCTTCALSVRPRSVGRRGGAAAGG
jgi:hypothetical protein